MELWSGAFERSGAIEAPGELLAAARQAFTERGFSGSRLPQADELFVELWAGHQAAHDEATSGAVAQARQQGITDPGQLFEAGARAYLQGSWHRRDLALLFSSGDAPREFAALERRRRRQWLLRNSVAFNLSDGPEDRLYAATLTSVVGRGAREVATAGNFRLAMTVIDAVMGYARLLIADRPRSAGHGEHGYAGLPAVRGLGSGLGSTTSS
jgi:hypothetical protein